MFALAAAIYIFAAILIPVITTLYLLGPSSALGMVLYAPLTIGPVRLDGGLAFIMRGLMTLLVAYAACYLGLLWRTRNAR